MTKHLTKRICEEMHYLPANNAFAFYLVHGLRAKEEYLKAAEKMRERSVQHGYCPQCTDTLVRWYLSSCQQVLDDINRGKKPDQTYPVIVLPQCCNPEIN